MTDRDTRFQVAHDALRASLADDDISLPITVTVDAVNRILTRLDALNGELQ